MHTFFHVSKSFTRKTEMAIFEQRGCILHSFFLSYYSLYS